LSYTVIARRWRPKKFEDVVGQAHIVTTIKNSIRLKRIPHAYLFTGPRGVGKTSLARILAKAVNCLNDDSGEPCGVCENCVSIDHGRFVDLVEIDAASKRRLVDIRELIETVRYVPMRGAYKVYILDESHMLINEAWNAFLKTLEEPPGHTIFILSTTQPEDVPYTIMSRCQRFDFRKISEAGIAEQLKRICDEEEIGYDEGVINYVARVGDGSMRDAETILEQIIAYGGKHISEKDVMSVVGIVRREVLHGIVKSILDRDLKTGLELIEGVLNEGYDVYQIYEGLIYFVRNLLILKVCGGVPGFLDVSEEEHERSMMLLKDLEYYEIQNMLNYMLKAEDLLKGTFPKVALEIVYVNLYNLSRLRDVEKVIDTIKVIDSGNRPEGRHEETHGRIERSAAPVPVQVNEEVAHSAGQEEVEVARDARGFIEYLKRKKPFMGSLFDLLESKVENNSLVVFLDTKHGYIREDGEQREEIKRYLREFFGCEMGLSFKEAGETRKSILEQYVKEAETLFKV
jgi:DNA polymerase III subunit gamma/tau